MKGEVEVSAIILGCFVSPLNDGRTTRQNTREKAVTSTPQASQQRHPLFSGARGMLSRKGHRSGHRVNHSQSLGRFEKIGVVQSISRAYNEPS